MVLEGIHATIGMFYTNSGSPLGLVLQNDKIKCLTITNMVCILSILNFFFSRYIFLI